jgi:hypothetical protein
MHTKQDWFESGRDSIIDTISDLNETINSETAEIYDQNRTILTSTPETLDEVDKDLVDEIKEYVTKLKQLLVEYAQTILDQAHEVSKLTSGATLRNLRGEEPLNYSTPDGGAKHDAYYGMQAMNRNYARYISWPLQLDNVRWTKQKAKKTGEGSFDLVSAAGTKKYTRIVGGAEVSVVIDERDRSPI